MNYLKYIANTGRVNQHPYGEIGTNILLNKFVSISDYNSILEIGCRTGHTAAIISNNKTIQYNGIDSITEMIEFCEKK